MEVIFVHIFVQNKNEITMQISLRVYKLGIWIGREKLYLLYQIKKGQKPDEVFYAILEKPIY